MKQFHHLTTHGGPPFLDDVFLVDKGGVSIEVLSEGKLLNRRLPEDLRFDKVMKLMAGDEHGQVFGRKGPDLGILLFDRTEKQGQTFKLHDRDAILLRRRGFEISEDNIVKWLTSSEFPKVLDEEFRVRE